MKTLSVIILLSICVIAVMSVKPSAHTEGESGLKKIPAYREFKHPSLNSLSDKSVGEDKISKTLHSWSVQEVAAMYAGFTRTYKDFQLQYDINPNRKVLCKIATEILTANGYSFEGVQREC